MTGGPDGSRGAVASLDSNGSAELVTGAWADGAGIGGISMLFVLDSGNQEGTKFVGSKASELAFLGPRINAA